MVLQVNKIAIAKLITPIGQFFRNDMSMAVNFEHGVGNESRNIEDFYLLSNL